ncbi:unnamed protein product [Prunus armeniaca]
MITQKLTSSQPRSHFLTANLGDYCLHHNQPSISSLKTTSTKADTPSLLPKEDTLPRCQAPAETPDCQSSQTVKPNSHDTCHHRGDLHRVPHRKSTPTSHFHFPIKREQYPSKRDNLSKRWIQPVSVTNDRHRQIGCSASSHSRHPPPPPPRRSSTRPRSLSSSRPIPSIPRSSHSHPMQTSRKFESLALMKVPMLYNAVEKHWRNEDLADVVNDDDNDGDDEMLSLHELVGRRRRIHELQEVVGV